MGNPRAVCVRAWTTHSIPSSTLRVSAFLPTLELKRTSSEMAKPTAEKVWMSRPFAPPEHGCAEVPGRGAALQPGTARGRFWIPKGNPVIREL